MKDAAGVLGANPQQAIGGRVHINGKQYFEGVPKDVWEFQIGGYQVLHKWLKDRRGRLLTFDDLTHYQKIGHCLAANDSLDDGN